MWILKKIKNFSKMIPNDQELILNKMLLLYNLNTFIKKKTKKSEINQKISMNN